MSSPTLDTFLDIAAALDFDLSCQHHQHQSTHATDDPAAYFVWTRCPKCRHARDYYLCESGRVRMWRPRTLGCTRAYCGATGTWDDFVILYASIGSK